MVVSASINAPTIRTLLALSEPSSQRTSLHPPKVLPSTLPCRVRGRKQTHSNTFLNTRLSTLLQYCNSTLTSLYRYVDNDESATHIRSYNRHRETEDHGNGSTEIRSCSAASLLPLSSQNSQVQQSPRVTATQLWREGEKCTRY